MSHPKQTASLRSPAPSWMMTSKRLQDGVLASVKLLPPLYSCTPMVKWSWEAREGSGKNPRRESCDSASFYKSVNSSMTIITDISIVIWFCFFSLSWLWIKYPSVGHHSNLWRIQANGHVQYRGKHFALITMVHCGLTLMLNSYFFFCFSDK